MKIFVITVFLCLSGCGTPKKPKPSPETPSQETSSQSPGWSHQTLAERPRNPNAPPAVSIATHYDRASRDECPRINMKLTRRGEKDDVFSVLFDTGSDESFIMDGTVAANKHIGYKDGSLGTRIRTAYDLGFGIPGADTGVVIDRVVKEHAELLDGSSSTVFKFDLELNVANAASDRLMVGAGLLGTARTGQFAEAAGLFAYIPPRITGSEEGKILIGENSIEEINALCRDPIRMVRLARDSKSIIFFMSEGSLSVGDNPSSDPLWWAVDTGANGLNVPESFLHEVLDMIAAAGGKRISTITLPGYLPIIDNCKQTRSGYPTIHVRVAGTTVAVKPDDYLITGIPELPEDSCAVNIASGDLGLEGIHLLGSAVLNNVISVFDGDTGRVGVCNPK